MQQILQTFCHFPAPLAHLVFWRLGRQQRLAWVGCQQLLLDLSGAPLGQRQADVCREGLQERICTPSQQKLEAKKRLSDSEAGFEPGIRGSDFTTCMPKNCLARGLCAWNSFSRYCSNGFEVAEIGNLLDSQKLQSAMNLAVMYKSHSLHADS